MRSSFCQSYSDYSLFTNSSSNTFLCILIYVDHLFIIGTHPDAIYRFKTHLNICFHMKHQGPLKYFLEIEVAQNHKDMYLCQRNMP